MTASGGTTAGLAVPGGAPLLEERAWLDQLAAQERSSVLIGATGHLELSADEEAEAASRLRQELPLLLSGAAAESEILLLSGLAPGADLLFSEVAAAQLASVRRDMRQIGLLPVPVEVLWADWLMRAGTQDGARIAAMRARFDANLRACAVIVRLWDYDDIDWSHAETRQRQYRRLAALLCEHCEILVAILRAGHKGQPGGAAEVVSWRRRATPIPSEVRSSLRRHVSGWSLGDRLLQVDPAARGGSASRNPQLDPAREALRQGNYLACYDLVVKAEQQGHATSDLQYLKLLALANAGSTAAALRRFEEQRNTQVELSEDWLALEGRLHKDLGLRGGAAAVTHLGKASECYEAAFRRTGGYFTAINAATTRLLAGDTEGAQKLARDLLGGLGRFKPRDEADHYYLQATDAEASLLLGDVGRAHTALTEANRLLRGNINARSRSLQQLRLICRRLKLDERVLDALQLPPVLYLPPSAATGPLPQLPAEASFIYAGITEPRELELVEAALERGLRVHVVLAAPVQKMVEHWQGAHGVGWTLRLTRAMELCHDRSVALGFLDGEDPWADSYVAATALGLSRLAARRLGCRWLTPVGSGWGEQVPDVSSLLANAQATPVQVADHQGTRTDFTRRFTGLIFADFAGYSRLPDTELPAFLANFLQAIALSLAPQRADILLQNTWGDAVHLVTSNTRTAALCACAIQDCLERIRPQLPAALQKLELRLSAHFAPVFGGRDPVQGSPTFFGTQLSFTARIEPVTPPGMIFVTEAFAARIALEAPEDFVLEYAGEIKLAKNYGQSRLFSLRQNPLRDSQGA